jgi:putative transposase
MGDVPLSKVVQNFSFRYARWINQNHNRIGHLFQGRHKAILVDADSYLLGLIRYVHLNPIRAQLVTKVEEYQWSSYRAYMGYEYFSWLTCDWVLSQFSSDREKAINQFQQFMYLEIQSELYQSFEVGNQKGAAILANDYFLENLQFPKENNEILLDLKGVVESICSYYEVYESSLCGASRARSYARIRAIIAWLAQSLGICTLTAVAKYFNRDVTGLIRIIGRFHKDDKTLKELALIRDLLIKPISQA